MMQHYAGKVDTCYNGEALQNRHKICLMV